MARLTFRYALRNDDGETDARVHELMAVAVPAPFGKLGPGSYVGDGPVPELVVSLKEILDLMAAPLGGGHLDEIHVQLIED